VVGRDQPKSLLAFKSFPSCPDLSAPARWLPLLADELAGCRPSPWDSLSLSLSLSYPPPPLYGIRRVWEGLIT
jgi:hypothetical protein